MPLRITSNMILQQTIYSTRSGILTCWFSYVVSYLTSNALIYAIYRPGSSEVPRNPLTRWDVSSIPANGIFLTKKQKNKTRNAQRVEND